MIRFQGLPEPLQEIVDHFASLPGVGPKSALRMALALLSWSEEHVRVFGEHLSTLWERLQSCSRCGALADSNPCSICANSARDTTLLCIVPEWDALLSMEEVGLFRGMYLILGGLLAPLDGVDASRLQMQLLEARLREGHVREIILALGSTTEAEITASFIKNFVSKSFPSVQVSRLAQGIPLGADIKYVDKETLKQSLQYRQTL